MIKWVTAFQVNSNKRRWWCWWCPADRWTYGPSRMAWWIGLRIGNLAAASSGEMDSWTLTVNHHPHDDSTTEIYHSLNTQNQRVLAINDAIHRVISSAEKSWLHNAGWCPAVELVCIAKLAVLAFLALDVSARHVASSCIAGSLQRHSYDSSVPVGTSLSLPHEASWYYKSHFRNTSVKIRCITLFELLLKTTDLPQRTNVWYALAGKFCRDLDLWPFDLNIQCFIFVTNCTYVVNLVEFPQPQLVCETWPRNHTCIDRQTDRSKTQRLIIIQNIRIKVTLLQRCCRCILHSQTDECLTDVNVNCQC